MSTLSWAFQAQFSQNIWTEEKPFQPIEDLIFQKLQQDVATRWNSTYMMLTRLLEVKDALTQYYVDHPKKL